jgi:hypothetical protein
MNDIANSGKKMSLLPIDDLKAGMVLAAPVRNHQDQLLLDAGRKVMLKHIHVFKAWGIRRVDVKPAPGDAGEGSPAATAPVDQALRQRFADVEHDPLMAAIMLAAGRQLAARKTGP